MSDSIQIVKVGMADLNVLDTPGFLRTAGLGSCVGLCLYDARAQVAGMAHVMLPSSKIAREGEINIAKYADTAIPALIAKMKALGATQMNLTAKMAGGAQMFAFSTNSDAMRVGLRNAEACRQWLESYRIPLLAEDTGGNCGRTIEFMVPTGVLVIKTVQQGVSQI